MEVGFETVGNATVIVYDRNPLLVTDPWILGSAYFGSWILTHEIPAAQMKAIRQCEYVWLSHGHPDHANGESLELLRDKKILLPDHYFGRMCRGLKEQGFTVNVLPDRTWTQLSPKIRVLCIADYNQDAILLIDIAGTLFINLNDASDRGWGYFVKKIVAQYKLSFLAALTLLGSGADMMNFFTEDGHRILPEREARDLQLGVDIALRAERYGARFYVPFSSMHQYQRRDSVWANPYVASLADLPRGFHSKTVELLPAYVQYDCQAGQLNELNPTEVPLQVIEPEEYGDNWTEVLERSETEKVRDYFRSIQHLPNVFSHITMRVGGRATTIDLGGTTRKKSIMFETPRHSLMKAIEWQVFDDLLIGNFMKTTLQGDWGRSPKALYPDFSPYVAKYADNGGARTAIELRDYFYSYRCRDLYGLVRHRLQNHVDYIIQRVVGFQFRARIPRDSQFYNTAKRAYRFFLNTR
jgi:hypothetical protein